jgi:hypothetical protein
MTLGAQTVVVSLGADGALLVDGVGVLHAAASVESPKSTVGAGDALLAGYLAGTLSHDGDRPPRCARRSRGSAAVRGGQPRPGHCRVGPRGRCARQRPDPRRPCPASGRPTDTSGTDVLPGPAVAPTLSHQSRVPQLCP